MCTLLRSRNAAIASLSAILLSFKPAKSSVVLFDHLRGRDKLSWSKSGGRPSPAGPPFGGAAPDPLVALSWHPLTTTQLTITRAKAATVRARRRRAARMVGLQGVW